MKKVYFAIGLMAFFLSSSFKKNKACEYAGSNIGFVKTQTERALEESDLNKARFYTYKALNAIEKSKVQFTDCGCVDATAIIEEGLQNLKMATKATTLGATRILLNRALDNTLGSLEALENHDMHQSTFAANVLEMNTAVSPNAEKGAKLPEAGVLYSRIDESLKKYEASLEKIINEVNCKEARAYATRVFDQCTAQLLKPNLTEGKKYYNLRTKEITAAALKKLETCQDQ